MREAAAAAALLLALGLLAALRPPPPRAAPDPLPAASCAAWMADAVPGVGTKTRAAVAARIRAGEVPAAAAGWFAAGPARPAAR